MQHLFLIGYRGSGKSTVGRGLSDALQRALIDTDKQIEASVGREIKLIFEQTGEAGFRDLEDAAVKEASESETAAIVSLGGGAILREANRELIRRHGKCVWLRGSADSLFARISGDPSSLTSRPDLSDRGGFEEVVEMLKTREPFYADLADLAVDTDEKAPDELVSEIVHWLKTQAN